MPSFEVFDALAVLLEYPGEGHAARVREAETVLRRQAPDLARVLGAPLAELGAGDDPRREERYTRTFDWSPERALEVGWHLYGEQYDRGAFLVRMRALLRAHGVEEGSELPDRLGTLLRLLGRMDPEPARELSQGSLRPALAKMEQGFAAERENPYLSVLRAVASALPCEPEPARQPLPGGDACR